MLPSHRLPFPGLHRHLPEQFLSSAWLVLRVPAFAEQHAMLRGEGVFPARKPHEYPSLVRKRALVKPLAGKSYNEPSHHPENVRKDSPLLISNHRANLFCSPCAARVLLPQSEAEKFPFCKPEESFQQKLVLKLRICRLFENCYVRHSFSWFELIDPHLWSYFHFP
ncbi:hypothetical protein D3C80_1150050 [compost metagenome]